MKRLCLILLPSVLFCTSCAKLKNAMKRWSSSSPTISATTVEQHRQAFIGRIAAMPAYLVHEESPQAFRNRLWRGHFSYDVDRKTSYLSIDGDSRFGKRVFIGHKDGSLTIHISEGKIAQLYRYNWKEQCLEELTTPLVPLTPEHP